MIHASASASERGASAEQSRVSRSFTQRAKGLFKKLPSSVPEHKAVPQGELFPDVIAPKRAPDAPHSRTYHSERHDSDSEGTTQEGESWGSLASSQTLTSRKSSFIGKLPHPLSRRNSVREEEKTRCDLVVRGLMEKYEIPGHEIDPNALVQTVRSIYDVKGHHEVKKEALKKLGKEARRVGAYPPEVKMLVDSSTKGLLRHDLMEMKAIRKTVLNSPTLDPTPDPKSWENTRLPGGLDLDNLPAEGDEQKLQLGQAARAAKAQKARLEADDIKFRLQLAREFAS